MKRKIKTLLTNWIVIPIMICRLPQKIQTGRKLTTIDKKVLTLTNKVNSWVCKGELTC